MESLLGMSAGIRRTEPHRHCGIAYSSLAEINYMTNIRSIALLLLTTVVVAQGSSAQTPAKDPSTRLRQVLPADVAQRVLARIADARARQLPVEALANRALKFAAKGVDPKDIERSVNEQAQRMDNARSALVSGRAAKPAGDEIEAGAEALRKGVDGASVALLAKNAPSGRSLAVPLYVLGSLTDRGISSSQALQRVLGRLEERASDSDLESLTGELPAQAAAGQANRPITPGREFGQSHAPSSTGRPATSGPPAGVPANGGSRSNPGQSHRPPPTP
jgi:hypothetical protein